MGSAFSLQGQPAFADAVDGLTDPIDEDWVRNSLSWFPLLHAVPGWFIEDRVRDGVIMPSHAWKRILEGLCAATPPTEYRTIQAPTLILWGAQDGVLPRTDQEALAARIAGAVLTVYSGVERSPPPGDDRRIILRAGPAHDSNIRTVKRLSINPRSSCGGRA